MANTDTNTIVGFAKDVGELKGLVSAQTSAMNDLSARLSQLSSKVDKLIVYPVWGMTVAAIAAALAFIWKTLGSPWF